MNVARVEFQNRMDGVKQYMAFRKVGGELEARVSRFFDGKMPEKYFFFMFFWLASYRLIAFRLIKMRQKFIEQIIKHPSPRTLGCLRVAARRFSKRFICDFHVQEIWMYETS